VKISYSPNLFPQLWQNFEAPATWAPHFGHSRVGDMLAFSSSPNPAREFVMLPPIMITAPTRTILNPTDNISELAKKTVMYCVLAVEGTQIPTRQCTECSLPRRNRQSKRRQRRQRKLSHRFQTNDSFATIDLDHSEERPFIRFARKKLLLVQRSASRDPAPCWRPRGMPVP